MKNFQEKLNENKNNQIEEIKKQTEAAKNLHSKISDFEAKLSKINVPLKEEDNILLKTLSYQLKNAPNYSNIPREINHIHNWDMSEKAGTWFTFAVAIMILFGLGGFGYGFYQHQKKATPEREKFKDMEKLLEARELQIETLLEQKTYLLKYSQFMGEKNPNSHATFIKQNPPPKSLK